MAVKAILTSGPPGRAHHGGHSLQFKTAAHLFGTVAAIALMAGCASKPQVTAQQETSHYLSRAGRNYTPPGPASDPWGPYVREASEKYDVPEKWIREVMRQESGGRMYGRGGDLITSGAGAMGLMQVMPATYDDLRGRYRELSDDPFNPHSNIMAGTAYLREMYDIYGAPGFLAAYNAGPGRLDDYLTRNRTLPTETRRYVAAIGPRIAGYEPQRASPGAQYAMNSMPLDIPSGPRYPRLGTQFANAAPFAAAPFAATVPVPAEVAEAPRPFITLNPPAPMLVAQAEPPRPYITLNSRAPAQPEFDVAQPVVAQPEPVAIAQAEPPRYIQLSPRAADDAEGAPSLLGSARPGGQQFARAEALPIPEPPPLPPSEAPPRFGRRAAPSAPRPIEVAMFPEPPRPPSQRAAAASELLALGPQARGFNLIPSANAAPVRRFMPAIAATSGAWAVQVGAFANETLAKSATVAARGHAPEVLGGARSSVAGVRQPGGTLYRARLGGLSREAASQACERLSRARTNCMVVSPDAQH